MTELKANISTLENKMKVLLCRKLSLEQEIYRLEDAEKNK